MNSDATPPSRIEYRVTRRLAPLLEFDVQTVVVGKADDIIDTIAPGIKV
ncbi:MAG: hypothetical protein L0Y67_06185 [Gammaproteobacteria bacterium]|nr:hypothetical protein [Gammaproteobacteria bacterium]MCI0591175.1 hypothetical protein [Gammaproteobacteria bacterium]